MKSTDRISRWQKAKYELALSFALVVAPCVNNAFNNIQVKDYINTDAVAEQTKEYTGKAVYGFGTLLAVLGVTDTSDNALSVK